MAAETVLIVDDDAALRKVLAALLKQAGLGAIEAESAREALQSLEKRSVDAVISDLRMPGMSGMEFLEAVGRSWPGLPVIVLTAHGTVALAVEAMKKGAQDFMLKPFERDEVLFVVNKALLCKREERPLPAATREAALLGASSRMSTLQQLITRSAAATATVLIRGETGTGKELVARAIHDQSPRRGNPFVKLHCAALPDALLESELFGHEKGAFTGASARKLGRVELAAGGTLFLDEIGDVPLSTQVKLLRLLQEREIERVGGVETLHVDARFVAATHRNLEEMVGLGTFREDLFYRLNVIPIEVPPLRARPGDTELLARRFAKASAVANQRPELEFEDDALRRLAEEPWPGNVRQLENLVERLVVLAEAPRIRLEDVEKQLALEAARWGAPVPANNVSSSATGSLGQQKRDLEHGALLEALAKARNNRTLAARILGLSRRTLYTKLEEYGIE